MKVTPDENGAYIDIEHETLSDDTISKRIETMTTLLEKIE